MWAVGCLYIPRFPLQVELLRDPSLAGTPVALISPDTQRVQLASGEAERAGVAPSMPARQAVAICRNLAVLPWNYPSYRQAWEGVLEALYTVSPCIEPETEGVAFLDIRGLPALEEGPGEMARAIEAAVPAPWRAQVGLAANKFVARVAARRAEPGAPRWVAPGEAASFLAFHPLEWVPATPEIHRRWRLLGLHMMGQLARLPRGAVEAQFGLVGRRAWLLCRGEDDEPLRPHRWPETISEKVVFPQPVATRDAMVAACEQLVSAIWGRRERRGRLVQKVRLQAVLEGGGAWEQVFTLKQATGDARRLAFCLRGLLQRQHPPEAVEELVLEVLEWSDSPGVQGNLFGAGQEVVERLGEAVRELKARYGYSPISRLVEVEPWSRIPERHMALVEYEP